MGRYWKAIVCTCAVIALARPPMLALAEELEVTETTETTETTEKTQIVQGMTEEEIVTLASETATNTAIETISDIYDNGSIGTTYVTYFRDVYANISPKDNYVAFRQDQYTYQMIFGDITLNGTTFTCNNCTSVYIDTGSGYNSGLTYNVGTFAGDIDVGSNLVYSDLGSYPSLGNKTEVMEYAQTILMCVIGLCMFIRGIFEWYKCIC